MSDPTASIAKHDLVMAAGRRLVVFEYGDPSGHPAFFFHGLIGSHHQASFVAGQARRRGLRIVAPNRPGVGGSEFIVRTSPLDAVADVENVADALKFDDFSLIGISGGAPYVLAALSRLGARVRTATVISGMGPTRSPGALSGMSRTRRMFLELGSRYPHLARRFFREEEARFRADPDRFLDRLVATWPPPDRRLFRRREIYDMFMLDLHQVFTEGKGPESLAQELTVFRNYGVSLGDLPGDKRVTLWQGLSDTIVSPAMAWTMARVIPNCEAHFVPGGHFVAIEIAEQIISRLRQLLDAPGKADPHC